ncbi:MAG: hypothetical protein Q9219_006467 [cf. Caloplaca sp. 3 TL-2023]
MRGRDSSIALFEIRESDELSANQHVALKILSANTHGYYNEKKEWIAEQRTLEREVLQRITDSDSDHPGRKHIPRLLDSFEHIGPHGKHACLVLPVLGRSIYEFSNQWEYSRTPSPIMREIAHQLLQAMDFLHREMGVVHTDIKNTNILLELTNPVPDYPREYWIQHLLDCIPVPVGISYPLFDHVESRSIYAPIEDPKMVSIQLADFGSEVALMQPWSTPVDIWSAGVTIFEMITGRKLFGGKSLKDQLAQMAACLGPFPDDLTNNVITSGYLFNPQTALEKDKILRGEELFSPDGTVKTDRPHSSMTLEKAFQASPREPDSESPLSAEERRDFIAFIRSMLRLSPQVRKIAEALLEDPWLHKQGTPMALEEVQAGGSHVCKKPSS